MGTCVSSHTAGYEETWVTLMVGEANLAAVQLQLPESSLGTSVGGRFLVYLTTCDFADPCAGWNLMAC